MIRRGGRQPGPVRCAIYTRVSTSMQAEGEFSSIDNQREAGESLVRLRQEDGWQTLPTRYDDPGYSAATINRPALQRLLADVDAGLVDVVIVYKLDRLSRHQRDILDLLDRFSRRSVAFKSVTQDFDTTGAMGKALLGMMGVFAELERGMISERTRDKVLAARGRGRWTGGIVPLGYDLVDGKLVPNEDEAHRVREIYRLYLERRTITGTLGAVHDRGWSTKSWTTKTGALRQGRPFKVDSLRRLLASPYPAGRISSGDQVVEAEHESIVEPSLWDEVQRLLQENSRDGGRKARNRSGALLKGILRCGVCGSAMSPSHTRKGAVRYPYYTCVRRNKEGATACPHGKVSATRIEEAVIEQIRQTARDPEIVEAAVSAAEVEHQRQLEVLRAEIRATEAELARLTQEQGNLAGVVGRGGDAGRAAEARLGELAEQERGLRERTADLRAQLEQREAESTVTEELRRTLESFDPVWEVLEPAERVRLVQLIIAEAAYDGAAEELGFELAGAVAPAETEAA